MLFLVHASRCDGIAIKLEGKQISLVHVCPQITQIETESAEIKHHGVEENIPVLALET